MLINEMLGIKYPIIQGAMTLITDGKFAACVSNAGGLGIIASGEWDKNRVREEIHIARSLTDKPFGVNLYMMSPYVEDIVDLIIEEKIPVVTTGAHSPEKYIKRFKEAGCKVFPVVASVTMAKRIERFGIDGVIAEGMESGGHVGEATTMSLLPQMVKALKVPVIAAGGIASGSQMTAALAMGASGIQIGTILLASEECDVHENYKKAILKAHDNDTTVILKMNKGKINGNYAKFDGGGAYLESGFDICDVTMEGNEASKGGAVFVFSGYLGMSGSSKITYGSAAGKNDVFLDGTEEL